VAEYYDYYGISMRKEQERLEEEKRKDILIEDIYERVKNYK